MQIYLKINLSKNALNNYKPRSQNDADVVLIPCWGFNTASYVHSMFIIITPNDCRLIDKPRILIFNSNSDFSETITY